MSYTYKKNIIKYNKKEFEITLTRKLGLTHTKPQILYYLPLCVLNFLIFLINLI